MQAAPDNELGGVSDGVQGLPEPGQVLGAWRRLPGRHNVSLGRQSSEGVDAKIHLPVRHQLPAPLSDRRHCLLEDEWFDNCQYRSVRAPSVSRKEREAHHQHIPQN